MDARLLDEAADWLVRLNDEGLTAAERVAFERWRQASPAHEGAWMRAERLMDKLGGLPPALAMPALGRSQRRSRRAAVAKLAVLLAAVPGGWMSWRVAQQQGWAADLRTVTGEQRLVTLADGSRLLLDTGTAVDIRFDAHQRLIHLHRGSILLETAADPSGVDRPLLVATAVGRLRALGTRFSVQQNSEGKFVDLAVTQGAVEVTLLGASRPALVVPAGNWARLTALGAGAADGRAAATGLGARHAGGGCHAHGRSLRPAVALPARPAALCPGGGVHQSVGRVPLGRYRPGLGHAGRNLCRDGASALAGLLGHGGGPLSSQARHLQKMHEGETFWKVVWQAR
jgi:transmembrane sensor